MSSKQKIEDAKKVLQMIVDEMPKTMGAPNFQLLYDDVKKALDILKKE